MSEPNKYIRWIAGVKLRPYQKEPLKRILDSIEKHLGDTIILLFPRQSGKDELLVQLKAYLLHLYAPLSVGIVEVNPTQRPQTTAALERFERSLSQNRLVWRKWRKRGATMRLIGKASVSFLSGDRSANTRGASASLLLIVNEAQDILPSVYGQVLEPMTASMNATRLLAGTAWTSDTLLAREIRAARQAEHMDGRKRVFTVDADAVQKSVEWYGAHVEAAIRKYGREHPFVKTQYFNEEIDARGGMFTAAHRALMGASPASPARPPVVEGRTCAFLIDVAGQEEASTSASDLIKRAEPQSRSDRDAVTLRIVEIDLTTLETLHKPTYRAIHLEQWTGQNHLTVFGQIKALAETWQPRHFVIDATGVGEGLWAMLDKAFPTRVIPVKFTQSTKSELGYGFLAIIHTGRFRDEYASRAGATAGREPDRAAAGWGYFPGSAQIDREYAACESEILAGPQKLMRWGVPEGRRDEEGHLIHDDIPVTDSLTAILDRLDWQVQSPALIIPGRDPLDEIDNRYRWLAG
ncbi:MAG TPA: hypothetical protein VMJ64_18825 [Anaerolineales bacterium]|nr:hypothetical protein [Anaerolineales bacterium]